MTVGVGSLAPFGRHDLPRAIGEDMMGTWFRRGIVFMCSALLTALLGLAAATPSYGAATGSTPGEVTLATSGPSVAMWAWNWTDSAAMVSFAQANGVTEIFAYVAPGFTDPTYIPWGWSQPQLPLEESLAADAAAAGITVYAMGGDPSWVPNPTYGTGWANEALATGLFRGIHVELEPWALSSWGTDQSGTIDQYLVELAGIHAVAATYGVPDEISIPYWLSMYSTSDRCAPRRGGHAERRRGYRRHLLQFGLTDRVLRQGRAACGPVGGHPPPVRRRGQPGLTRHG